MDELTDSHLDSAQTRISLNQKLDARRYHALIELIDTEQNYVQDLDVLVNIYLASLPNLVIPQRTRSTSSFRFSNPETTFSRFTSNHAATSPPTPANLHAQAQEFFSSRDASLEQQRPEKSSLHPPAHSHPPSASLVTQPKAQMPSMLPLLTEDESSVLARNASALLHLHSTFAQTLLKCVAKVGLELRNTHYRPGSQAVKLDKAVGAVCEQFIEKAPHFDVYEVFCSGHADALELMRRVQGAHPVVWDAWEHRCAARSAGSQFMNVVLPAPEPVQSDHRKEQSTSSSKTGDIDQKDKDISNVPVFDDGASDNQAADAAQAGQAVEKILIEQTGSVIAIAANLPTSTEQRRDTSDDSAEKEQSLESESVTCHSPPPASDTSSQLSCPSRHSLQLEPESIPVAPNVVSSDTELDRLQYQYTRRDNTVFSNSRRLSFADYLIKPIQRICRYPLLLDQLKRTAKERVPSDAPQSSEKASPAVGDDNMSTDDLVERALASMRRAAQAVDEARRRRDSLARARVAATRFQAHPRCPFPPPFLEELGPCNLVGGLDVVYVDGAEALRQSTLHNLSRKDSDGGYLDASPDMHAHSQPVQYSRTRKSLRAKYLGAFLYSGGYFVLAKPIKAGVYEAKHWFQLTGFEIVDVDDSDGNALLPHSFRLVRSGHRFDLSAISEREKGLWLSALRESRTVPPAWKHKPVSSIFLHEDPVFEDDDTLEAIQISNTKPKSSSPFRSDNKTIRSNAAVQANASTSNNLNNSTPTIRGPPKSTSGLMSLFTAGSLSTISLVSDDNGLAVRPTPASRRSQIDRLFVDVFSESCLVARAVATKDDRSVGGTPFTVLTGRGATSDTEIMDKSPSSVKSGVNLGSPDSAYNNGALSSATFPLSTESHLDHTSRTVQRRSLDISSSTLTVTNSSTSVALEKFPTQEMENSTQIATEVAFPDDRPRRSYSLADNMKGFFAHRSPSNLSTTPTDEESPVPGGQHLVARLWRSASLRTRTNSAPTMIAVPSDMPTMRREISAESDIGGPVTLTRSPSTASMPVLDQNDLSVGSPEQLDDAIYMTTARSSLDERPFSDTTKNISDGRQHNPSTLRKLFKPRQSVVNSLTPISSVR